MLSNKDAFKVGFLSRCVEEGLTLQEAHARVKVALDKLAFLSGVGKLVGSATDLLKPAVNATFQYGVPAMLAAPPILGGLAGYGLAKATDIDDADVDEVKKRELIEELNRQTQRLRRDKALRDYRLQNKQPRRLLLS